MVQEHVNLSIQVIQIVKKCKTFKQKQMFLLLFLINKTIEEIFVNFRDLEERQITTIKLDKSISLAFWSKIHRLYLRMLFLYYPIYFEFVIFRHRWWRIVEPHLYF